MITGGATGIGQAIAESFRRDGAEVIVAGLSTSKAGKVAAKPAI